MEKKESNLVPFKNPVDLRKVNKMAALLETNFQLQLLKDS